MWVRSIFSLPGSDAKEALLDLSDLTFRGNIVAQEPLSRHTSLKVGGPADLFAVPADADDLLKLVSWLDERGIHRVVIGGGYNLLVRDGGLRGAVISLERLNRIESLDSPGAAGGMVRAEAGAENLAVVRFAQERGFGGIGFIAGIPGTIGGAVRMNAGAYGEGLLERAVELTLVRTGEVVRYPMGEIDFGYRRIRLLPGDIILALTLHLEERDPEATEAEIRKDLELRRTKHAVGHPSAGSFFKNPPGQAAWRLIDQAGLRGVQIGGAQVSEVHSNFLINRGGATARDFLELAALVKERVRAVAGVELEEEVRILGEE